LLSRQVRSEPRITSGIKGSKDNGTSTAIARGGKAPHGDEWFQGHQGHWYQEQEGLRWRSNDGKEYRQGKTGWQWYKHG
jgi:hypothetical protein